MRNYKQLLISFIEVVTFLLAAFGGFLRNIAPPDQVGASFPVGILSFLTLIVLMIISAIARNAPAKTVTRRWIAAGIIFFLAGLPATFIYRYMIGHYTYPQHLELNKRRIAASDADLTADARQYRIANADATSDDLARNLPEGDVWTKDAIERIELQLLAAYTCLVLSLSGAIFCLLEANSRQENTDGDPAVEGPKEG